MAAKETAKKKDPNVLEIPPIKLNEIIVHIKGDTDLIFHKWSEKAKEEMRSKQQKKATKSGRDAKDPEADTVDTLYFLEGEPTEKTMAALEEALRDGARIGFPSTAFKQSAIMGAYRSQVLDKTTVAKAAIFIPGEFVEIKFESVLSREDMVKVGGMTKVADIRYRAAVRNWSADVTVRYNSRIMSIEQVTNLFRYGGFACGVGEWRNERDGNFGAYSVTGVTEVGEVII